jgi:2'-5' RNA ligase
LTQETVGEQPPAALEQHRGVAVPLSAVWPEVEVFDDHRRWRPEWTEDRSCLYWYLTFADQPSVAGLAQRVGARLSELPAIDPVPPKWLHLTLCDVGFLDEVEPRRLAAMTDVVAGELRRRPPIDLTLGPVAYFPDAVTLAAGPRPRLLELRRRIGRAMESVGLVPQHHLTSDFLPHVTLGYLNRRADRPSVVDALDDTDRSLTVRVDQVTLAAVTRRAGHYQWDAGGVLTLGRQTEATGEASRTGSESTP